MSQSKSRTRSGRLCSSALLVSCDVRNNWIAKATGVREAVFLMLDFLFPSGFCPGPGGFTEHCAWYYHLTPAKVRLQYQIIYRIGTMLTLCFCHCESHDKIGLIVLFLARGV